MSLFEVCLLVIPGLAIFCLVVFWIMCLLSAMDKGSQEREMANKAKLANAAKPKVQPQKPKPNPQKKLDGLGPQFSTKPQAEFSTVLIYLFIILTVLFCLCFFGFNSSGLFVCAYFLIVIGLFSALGSSGHSGSYYSGSSSYRGNNEPAWDDDYGHSSWSNNRIYDSRGNMVNGKLLEYYRNVEKTGIADIEYEQELKDGYSYCDDHDDYDDCRDD